jgi:hypothetical protein
LEYRYSEWDDDPQEGKAFYIYFLGLPPGDEPSELTGAVDCIAFTPNTRRIFRPAARLPVIARRLGQTPDDPEHVKPVRG